MIVPRSVSHAVPAPSFFHWDTPNVLFAEGEMSVQPVTELSGYHSSARPSKEPHNIYRYGSQMLASVGLTSYKAFINTNTQVL